MHYEAALERILVTQLLRMILYSSHEEFYQFAP